MKAEQVVEKILAQAKAEADGLIAEAQSKIDAQKATQKANLDAYAKQTATLAQQAAADKQLRMLAAARMEMQKQTLGAKVALLDELFAKAAAQINALGDEAYLALMGDLISRAVQTGDEEVLVGAHETRIGHDFLKRINKKLGPGFKGNLRLAVEKADIDGGFILRRGKVQINCSTEILIAQVREEMEAELAVELFTD